MKISEEYYKTVLVDPPWPERGGGKIKRGADKHYNLMSIEEIEIYLSKIPFAKDCHLYLWVTNNYLDAGLKILKSLGFRYITNIVWVKDSMGLGQYFRGQHEICLFGVKGEFYSGSRKQSTVIKAKKREHSQKPPHLYIMAEAVSQPPRLEVFARNHREGWDVWGDEAPSEVQKLLK